MPPLWKTKNGQTGRKKTSKKTGIQSQCKKYFKNQEIIINILREDIESKTINKKEENSSSKGRERKSKQWERKYRKMRDLVNKGNQIIDIPEERWRGN